MGIPVYFKTLVSQYQDSILIKHQIDNVGSIFFDLNCLIHPCCHGETDETIMIQKIIQFIHDLVEYSNVQDLIYIAVDGVAPKGKMKQQQMRRFKSSYENKLWDTNAISPGTHFMRKLNQKLNKLSFQKIKLIINNSDTRGEGEHKILQYIKKNNLNHRIIIYGLDADLIMLSLVSQINNIYLLRERTEYNIEDTENDYIYLSIEKLKRSIIQDSNIIIHNENDFINDYIFICFLLGNDFINHLPSLSLRYNGYNILLETYKELQNIYQVYFRLIDTRLDHCIHLCFFKEFLYELSRKEKNILYKKNNSREKQYNKIYNQYHGPFNDFKEYCNVQIQNRTKINKIQSKNISLEDIYSYQNNIIHDKENVLEMINHLHILYYPEESNLLKQNQYYESLDKSKLCEDYLNSLLWTSHYYFKECIHWKWSTEFHKTPFLKDLYTYCKDMNTLSFEKDDKEFTQKQQLEYIFPQKSHHLHSFEIQKKKDPQMYVDLYMNRYLWECHIEFIENK